jgi:DnaK suppressor protein
LATARKRLESAHVELEAKIRDAQDRFQSLILDAGEGAGDDQADAGTKTFEREQEISVLANDRDLLEQTLRALERIANGTYGRCENCGKQIGKHRLLEGNPSATLCLPCREREDRS